MHDNCWAIDVYENHILIVYEAKMMKLQGFGKTLYLTAALLLSKMSRLGSSPKGSNILCLNSKKLSAF